MTAQDHVIAWIESDAAHYKRLLELYRRRQPGCRDGFMRPTGAASAAMLIVNSAYDEMLRTGDALSDDLYSPAELARAAVDLCEWELVA